jgi:hypothetical protein
MLRFEPPIAYERRLFDRQVTLREQSVMCPQTNVDSSPKTVLIIVEGPHMVCKMSSRLAMEVMLGHSIQLGPGKAYYLALQMKYMCDHGVGLEYVHNQDLYQSTSTLERVGVAKPKVWVPRILERAIPEKAPCSVYLVSLKIINHDSLPIKIPAFTIMGYLNCRDWSSPSDTTDTKGGTLRINIAHLLHLVCQVVRLAWT